MRKNYQLVSNYWRQSFFDISCRDTFSNNADNACGTAYIEVVDIIYQEFDLRHTKLLKLFHHKKTVVHDEIL